MRGGTNLEGFTLLEVLVALTIIALVFVGLLQVASSSLRSFGKSEEVLALYERAEEEMSRVVLLDSLRDGTEIKEDSRGFRIETTVEETKRERTEGIPVSLKKVTVVVRSAGGEREAVLETLLAVKKEEVTSARESR
ncbi:MAG: prepilin-type N-terminal cleavage/methylation domain-containing protein [Deltaproteobacteria bacterium]|nr:MAG: prepilin-type N-terminal cleavage/methylation domain-containing protein [Deltaproteobacteria bacterium]